MLHSESIQYLEKAGFHYKPAESPDLWSHLEAHFAGPKPIGPKFSTMPANFIAELIMLGEEALLEALVTHHRQTGSPGKVARVIELPYVVGTQGAVHLSGIDPNRVMHLVENPGTSQERVIHVVAASADDIPCTSQMTVTGGVYADGHTAGYFDLCPGDHANGEDGSKDMALAYLATPDEIAVHLREMEMKAEDIAVITRRECDDMIAKAKKIMG